MQELSQRENETEARLRTLCPNHPAFRFIYHSAEAAIEAYETAIHEIYAAATAQPPPNTGAPGVL